MSTYPQTNYILTQGYDPNINPLYIPRLTTSLSDMPGTTGLTPGDHLVVNSTGTALTTIGAAAFNAGTYAQLSDVGWSSATAGYALIVGATGVSGYIDYSELPTGAPIDPEIGHLLVNDTISKIAGIQGQTGATDTEYTQTSGVVTANDWGITGTRYFSCEIAGTYTIDVSAVMQNKQITFSGTNGSIRWILSMIDENGNTLANVIRDEYVSNIPHDPNYETVTMQIPIQDVTLSVQLYSFKLLIMTVETGDYQVISTITNMNAECLLQERAVIPTNFYQLDDVDFANYNGLSNHPVKVNSSRSGIDTTGIAIEQRSSITDLGFELNKNNRLCYWYLGDNGIKYYLFRPPVILSLRSSAMREVNGAVRSWDRGCLTSWYTSGNNTPLLVNVSDNTELFNCTSADITLDPAETLAESGFKYFEVPNLSTSNASVTSLWETLIIPYYDPDIEDARFNAFDGVRFNGWSIPVHDGSSITQQIYTQCDCTLTLMSKIGFADTVGNQVIRMGVQVYDTYGDLMETLYDTTTVRRPFGTGFQTCIYSEFPVTLKPGMVFKPVMISYGFTDSIKIVQLISWQMVIQETFGAAGAYAGPS